MTRILTLLLLTSLTFASAQAFGQVDTTALKNFIQKQEPDEEKFIAFLKAGKTNDCMKYFSAGVIKKYGVDSLKKELTHLNILLSKYSSPKVTSSFGQNFRGIGTFGHDSDGSYEKQSLYQFMDMDNVVYYFSLYYNDKEPIALIKYYNSKNLQEDFLKNIKPTKPSIPVPKSGNQ